MAEKPLMPVFPILSSLWRQFFTALFISEEIGHANTTGVCITPQVQVVTLIV